MEPRYRFRLYLLTALVLVGAGTLLSQLYKFQIEDREFYRKRLPGDTSVAIREPGVRGIIVDRNGTVLADNVRNYELVFNLDEIHREWKRQHSEGRLGSAPVGMAVPTAEASRDIVKIVEDSIVPRLADHGITVSYSRKALQTHYVTHGGLVPFTFPVDLTYEQFARLAEHNLELAGVYVTVRPRRVYPYGTLACHMLGYLKQWEKGNIPKPASGEKKFDHYLGDAEGAAGLELTLNEELVGPAGKRVLRKNEKGRILGLEDYTRPGQGARVELTIDARAQYLVESVLRRAGRAAAVVLDPNTGEILAMASVPNYDPNEFIPSIDADKWKEYKTNPTDPLINRAITSFAPGSTFKLPTAIAAALHDKMGYTHNCVGYITYGRTNRQIKCWKTTGHGRLDFPSATMRSCNPFFMELATQLGSADMAQTFDMLNLGRPTGIRLPAEDGGIVPGSVSWRRERPGAGMTRSVLAMLAIGQADSQASPLQMASVVSCIANGGKLYQPRLVKQVVHPRDGVTISDIPKLEVDLLTGEPHLSKKDLDTIRLGMWKSANEAGGTARRASLKEIAVAAKTGTAQTTDLGQKSHNAWTVAFAPFENPRYAVAVVVQNGKSGGKVAGPLVHLILRGLFAAENGLQLPLARLGEVTGDFDPIEEIELPEDDLLSLAIDEEGETGEEASEVQPAGAPVKVKPRAIPLPSITPDADSGTSLPPGTEPPLR